MDKVKTGQLIREARNAKNYTQSELGDLVGVSNKAVSRWEKGETFPDVGVLELLSRVLDLSIQDIVTGEVVPASDQAVVEVVRIAKLQAREKRWKLVKFGLGILLLGYVCILSPIGLSAFGEPDFLLSSLYGISYPAVASMLLLFIAKESNEKEDNDPERRLDHKELWKIIFTFGTYLSVIFVMGISFWMVGNGKLPSLLELSSLGPLLNGFLTVMFLLNLAVVIWDVYCMLAREQVMEVGILVVFGTLFLSGWNSLLLYNFTTYETAVRILWTNISVISGEMIVFVAAGSIMRSRKKRKKES